MKAGAGDYLTKPLSLSELKLTLERIAADLRFKTDDRMRCGNLKNDQGFGGIIGRSAEMEKLYRLVAKASQGSPPVLFFGESGTGEGNECPSHSLIRPMAVQAVIVSRF